MRFLLITVGSRGDAEPFCSLAQALAAKDHQVDLFLQTDLAHLAPSSATVHELPFTQMDFYKYVGTPSHGADHENPRVRFVGIVTDIIAALVLPCCDAVLNEAVANNGSTDMIVTSSLARPLAMAVGQKCEIPTSVVHLQPLAPTDKFPHYSNAEQCVAALTNNGGKLLSSDKAFEEGYVELDGYHHEFLQDRLDEVYKKLDLPLLRYDELKEALAGHNGDKTLIFNAFSDELVPNVHDAAVSIYTVGPLADTFVASSFTPPEDLVAFLTIKCETTPPICIGYGSMPFSKASMILEALEQVNRKAILIGNALKVEDDDTISDWVKENVYQLSSAPYPWLLPQCAMMLSHGGAGVVNATIRAGIPPVISPLMGDQFFWAQLLEAKHVGVQAGSSMTALTKEDVVDAIQRADKCTEAAKELGEEIRANGVGVDRMVRVLEDHFSKK